MYPVVIEKKACESSYNQAKIAKLLEKIQIDTDHLGIYILACIHRSIVNERASYAPEHNERLEFLGDAVLELSITELLYNSFPDKSEGEMTDMRSALVRGRNLALVARSLELGEYLLLGKGEEKGGGRESDYILANTLEALIGAIYIDKGFEESHQFIVAFIFPTLHSILENRLYKDFKTLFQEEAQARFDITPRYDVLDESGLDHDKTFVVGVFLGEKQYGIGSGSSKKKAQEKAAENAFNTLS